MELIAKGLHPATSAKFQQLGIPACLIGQVIGNAPLSAGFHAIDGQWSRSTFPSVNPLTEDTEWVNYCAAVDLRVSHYNMRGEQKAMTGQEIHALVSDMSLIGICGFFRHPGFDGVPISWPVHVHLIDAGVKMKPELSAQVHDFRVGLNGLASHGPYSFFTCSQYASSIIHAQWQQTNGGG